MPMTGLGETPHALEAARLVRESPAGLSETAAGQAAVFASLYEHLEDTAIVFDDEWRYLYINPTATAGLRTLGREPTQLIGRFLFEEFPEIIGTRFDTGLREAVAAGRAAVYDEYLAIADRWFETRSVPFPGGIVSFSRDVTDRHIANERSERLFQLASLLSEAVTPEAVADVIFDQGMLAIGAQAGSLALLRDSQRSGMADAVAGAEFEVVRTRGYPPELERAYRVFPLQPGRPASDAALTKRPVLIASRVEWNAHSTLHDKRVDEMGYDAFAAVPIMSGERAFGTLSFSFTKANVFNEATRTFLETLGQLCGQALERARAFAAERRERERNETILGAITDAFVAFDESFRFTYANKRAQAALDRTSEQLIGKVLWDVFPIALTSPLQETLTTAMRERRATGRSGFSPVTGSMIDGHAYPIDDGIVFLFHDITMERRAQDATAFLAEASRVLSGSIDYKETLRNVAKAAVPRLGDWCAVDIVRDPLAEAWPPDLDRLTVVHSDPDLVDLGVALRSEYPEDWSAETGLPFVLRTGKPFFVPRITDEMLAGAARDDRHRELLRRLGFTAVILVPLVARGRTLGALTLAASESRRSYDEHDLALAEDLGSRAGIAVDNARLLRDAETANAAKMEFLRNVSHELRQPLNGIGGFLELLELELRGPINPQQREDLARIRRNQQHLLMLINDLLAFARLEAGQLVVVREPIAMDATLRSLDAMILPQMVQKEVDYIYEGCDPLLTAIGDSDRIVQICLNLLTNAARATDRGGRVSLTCKRIGDAVVVTVSDTGVGIPTDKMATIFEPFTQLGRALNQPREGAGLGLSISRGLAEAMGGALTVTSEPGRGSDFVLKLPAA